MPSAHRQAESIGGDSPARTCPAPPPLRAWKRRGASMQCRQPATKQDLSVEIRPISPRVHRSFSEPRASVGPLPYPRRPPPARCYQQRPAASALAETKPTCLQTASSGRRMHTMTFHSLFTMQVPAASSHTISALYEIFVAISWITAPSTNIRM